MGIKTHQPTGMSHHHRWEPGGAAAAGGFGSLLLLSFPCLGVRNGGLRRCSSGSLVLWMKPTQCYTQRLFLVKLTRCVLVFLVLGIFLFPLLMSVCRAWMRRLTGGMLQPAPVLQPALSLQTALITWGPCANSVNVADNSGFWLPFPLDGPGLVHGTTQTPEISFLGHLLSGDQG